MRKIKAIVKRPDELVGHMTYISDSLKNLQNIVGGYIQMVPISDKAAVICNEEGKLTGLPINCSFGKDILVGTIIIVGTEEDELADISLEMTEWKQILEDWGN